MEVERKLFSKYGTQFVYLSYNSSTLSWFRILTLVLEDSKRKKKKSEIACSVRHFLIVYSHGVLP